MPDIAFPTLLPQKGASVHEYVAQLVDMRRTRHAVALAIGARTATLYTAQIVNHDCSGIILQLAISAASGTGGLKCTIYNEDSSGGSLQWIAQPPTARIAIGIFYYFFHPSITAALNLPTTVECSSILVSRNFRVGVIHADGSSYTYGVDYCLIP